MIQKIIFLLLLTILSSFNIANAQSRSCNDFFFRTHKIEIFPVPPGTAQIREIGNGNFALIHGSPLLPAGSIIDTRTLKHRGFPETDSRFLLLESFEEEVKPGVKAGRYIVVKSRKYDPELIDIYTSEVELKELILSATYEATGPQIDPQNLNYLKLMLKETLGISNVLAQQITDIYAKTPHNTNIFVMRQFPKLVRDQLQQQGLNLIILNKDGNPIY